MRILLASAIEDSWTYIPEMVHNFQKRGAHVDMFSIHKLPNPVPILAKIGFRIPRLENLTRIELIKRELRTFGHGYDAINIHFAAPVFRHLVGSLRRRTRRLVTSIWGSEFLRASAADLADLSHTLSASHIVTTNNPEVRSRLVQRFPEIESKVRIVRFGLHSMDVIRTLQQNETQEESRQRLGVPLDKTIVTVGYNGRPEQQHAMMIQGVVDLPDELRKRIFVLVPMTYGANLSYEAEIDRALKGSGLAHRILNQKMNLDDVCRTRIVSDYAVNVQTTDSFSASIQEHVLAGSTMILANWLPYDVLEQLGVPMTRVGNAEDITAALVRHRAVKRRPESAAFRQAIYDCSSWHAVAENWLDLYRN